MMTHDTSHDAAGRHPVIHDVLHDEGSLHGHDALPHRVLVGPDGGTEVKVETLLAVTLT